MGGLTSLYRYVYLLLEKYMHIYIIEQLSTKRKYVGQTQKTDANIRWKEHLSQLRSGSHWNCFLLRAYKKYGESDFKFYVVESTDNVEQLNILETIYIQKLDVMNPRKGFNLRPGGNGKGVSNHTKQLLRDAALRQWSLQDKETVAKNISISTKNAMKSLSQEKRHAMNKHVYDDAVKKKISESVKKLWENPEYRKKYSKPRSSETKQKISESLKKRNKNNQLTNQQTVAPDGVTYSFGQPVEN